MHAQDVHHVELPVMGSMKDPELSSLQAKLKEVKMDIVSCWAEMLGTDEATDAQIFALAAKLKAKNVVALNPPEVALPRLSKLCDQNNLKLALVMPPKSFEGLSDRVGICLDTETADPSKLPERVIEVRVSGTDQQKNGAVIEALRKRNFKGVFCVNPDGKGTAQAEEKIAAAINAFNELVTKSAAAM
jgi:hypothetical protein